MRVAFYTTQSGRSPVEDFIDSLSKADQARFRDVFDGIQSSGLDGARVQFRQLRGKLWEIKFTAPSSGYRIAYVFVQKDVMVWLYAFKKTTQKTPVRDLDIAEKRMQEIL